MLYLRVSIATILVLLSIKINSQSCYNFHSSKQCNVKFEKGFKLYGQSESASLVINEKAILPVIFYGQKDYIITVCTQRGYYPVHYIIKDAETKSIIYDNMEDNYYESFGFTIENPKKVIFEVTLLAENIEPENYGEDHACVGIHIQWRRTAKTGFQ